MRILVALDDSECSQMALDHILNRECPDKSAFKLVHICEPFNPIQDPFTPTTQWSAMVDQENSRRRARAESMLQAAVTRVLRKDRNLEVTTHLADGDVPDECIINIAGEWAADLVVLGSHGRRGLNRLLLGSVAYSVLSQAPCSIEIVKPAKRKSISQTYNVLVCLDDSKYSDAAYRSVISRPWTEETAFKIVTVINSGMSYCADDANPAVTLRLLEEAEQEAARAKIQLRAKAAQMQEDLARNVEVDVLNGDPRQCILQVVEEWPADLVVLGSHGRTGFSRLFLGSVSQAISIQASCSVEVIKMPVSNASRSEKVALTSRTSP